MRDFDSKRSVANNKLPIAAVISIAVALVRAAKIILIYCGACTLES